MKMPEVCDENMTLPKGLEPSLSNGRGSWVVGTSRGSWVWVMFKK